LQGGEPDPVTGTGSTIGNSIVCINTGSDVCGGYVGAGRNKFCAKLRSDCSVAKHVKERCEEIKPGFYIKSGSSDAYKVPSVDLYVVGSEARVAFLENSFDDVSEVRKAFDQVNAGNVPLVKREDVDGFSRKLPSLDFFTPNKKRFKKNDLSEKFDAVLESVDEAEGEGVKLEGKESTNNVNTAVINKFLKELTNTVTENQLDASSALDKVHEVMSQLGIPPKSAPPTLWLGYMEHSGELKDVSDQLS